jgi:hypothetical protein
MNHKTHLPTVELVLAVALVTTVWLGVQAVHQASAAGLGQAVPTATATSTDTPTPTNTSTPTNTPASWRHERGGKL